MSLGGVLAYAEFTPGLDAWYKASATGELTLPAVTGEHYEGGHWLGTFAVYLTSGAGVR